MDIRKLIEEARVRKLSWPQNANRLRMLPACELGGGVPTLKPGCFRAFTPQLRERYKMFGRWEFAPRGDWLGLDDMVALWNPGAHSEWIRAVHDFQVANEENWGNDAAALFRADRLSLFAGSNLNYDRTFLLWLDNLEEPELWVYDGNGESRFRDLASYLRAYLDGNFTTLRRPWKLAELAEHEASSGD